jgi:hypothetical protein
VDISFKDDVTVIILLFGVCFPFMICPKAGWEGPPILMKYVCEWFYIGVSGGLWFIYWLLAK